jgi:two-component system sensor histidine kinase BarA
MSGSPSDPADPYDLPEEMAGLVVRAPTGPASDVHEASARPVDVHDIGSETFRLTELVDRRGLADLLASVERLFPVHLAIHGDDDEPLAGQVDRPSRTLPLLYDGRALGTVRIASRAGFAVGDEMAQDVTEHVAKIVELVAFSGHRALLTSRMHVASIEESYRELTRKNDELTRAYDSLKELDRLKSAFLATVSHELRTPLTSIMGYAEMLTEGIAGPLHDEQREFLGIIRQKSDQLLDLIMSLLDLSKLESGTTFVRRVETPLARVLDEARTTVAPTAQRKGVELVVECPEGLAVLGDAPRLRQVFINLAENAVKFTPEGGRVVLAARDVTIANDDQGMVLLAPVRRGVEVRVSDTGIGIPERERAKVFAPFYQVDHSSTREYGGTGLGLAIVKRLVEAHEGTIHIEGREPCGTVFVVCLPAPSGLEPDPVSSRRPRGSVPPVFEALERLEP